MMPFLSPRKPLFTLFTLGLAVFLSAASPAAARIVRTVEENFLVSPGGELRLSTNSGDVRLRTGEGDTVQIRARQVFRSASTEAEADEALDDMEFEMGVEGNDVIVISRPRRSGGGWGWFRSGQPRVTVDFEIVVPADYRAEISTSGGDIAVENLDGDAEVRTSGGDIDLGDIAGAVKASTSGGDISIRRGHGRVVATTSGGDIKIIDAAGDVQASTSGGDVRVERVTGNIRASTSGGNVWARIAGQITEDVSLSTSGGSVTAVIDEDAKLYLDASTSGGGVSADGLTIRIDQGNPRRGKLSGEVNGGGPTLRLRSSGGDIRIRIS